MMAAAASSVHAEDAVEYKPLSIGAMSEFGVIQGGRFGENSKPFYDEWVDHFGASLTQSVSVNGKWFLNVGIGGIFEFQKQEKIGALWGGTQYRSFFIGPTTADVEYEAFNDNAKSLYVGMDISV